MFGKLKAALSHWLEGGEDTATGGIVDEITSLEQLEEVLAISNERPVFIFKHCTRCPISFGANARVGRYIESKNADNGTPPEIYLVKVVESRAVSSAVQEKLGVMHKSPQIILVDKGRSVWNA